MKIISDTTLAGFEKSIWDLNLLHVELIETPTHLSPLKLGSGPSSCDFHSDGNISFSFWLMSFKVWCHEIDFHVKFVTKFHMVFNTKQACQSLLNCNWLGKSCGKWKSWSESEHSHCSWDLDYWTVIDCNKNIDLWGLCHLFENDSNMPLVSSKMTATPLTTSEKWLSKEMSLGIYLKPWILVYWILFY